MVTQITRGIWFGISVGSTSDVIIVACKIVFLKRLVSLHTIHNSDPFTKDTTRSKFIWNSY